MIDPGDPQYGAASYDSVVTGGKFQNIAQLGGNAPFTVQQPSPGLLDFWAIKPAGTPPNPPDSLVGTFTITNSGVLKFTAGPRASSIAGVTYSGGTSTVQFTTTVGNTYSLVYTNQLGGAATNWPVDAGTVIGDGNVDTINHVATGSAEFYRIRVQ